MKGSRKPPGEKRVGESLDFLSRGPRVPQRRVFYKDEKMIQGLDHIGVAVRSLEGSLVLYRDVLGFREMGEEEVPGMEVKVVKLSAPDRVVIELLEATRPSSAIAKFLEKKGEGIHHICFRVQGIEEILKELKERGVPLVDEKPRLGAGGHKVAFLHPKGTSGVLIELSE